MFDVEVFGASCGKSRRSAAWGSLGLEGRIRARRPPLDAISTPKRLAPEVHEPRGYLFWYLRYRVAVDMAALQEQTISVALDSGFFRAIPPTPWWAHARQRKAARCGNTFPVLQAGAIRAVTASFSM